MKRLAIRGTKTPVSGVGDHLHESPLFSPDRQTDYSGNHGQNQKNSDETALVARMEKSRTQTRASNMSILDKGGTLQKLQRGEIRQGNQ